MDSTDLIPWVDIETTGTDPETDYILEVGITLTDNKLNVLDSVSWTLGIGSTSTDHGYDRGLRIREVSSQKARNDPENDDHFVAKMHSENGLFSDVAVSHLDEVQVQRLAIVWLIKHGVEHGTLEVAGSTIRFDREFMARYMPDLNNFFHYRVIDVSTIKNLARRWAPETFARAKAVIDAAPKAHRTLADIEQSIAELKVYRDERFIRAETEVESHFS